MVDSELADEDSDFERQGSTERESLSTESSYDESPLTPRSVDSDWSFGVEESSDLTNGYDPEKHHNDLKPKVSLRTARAYGRTFDVKHHSFTECSEVEYCSVVHGKLQCFACSMIRKLEAKRMVHFAKCTRKVLPVISRI